MATTTTNYAFDVPTSSDLVKNGATAIAELGQDIDTFLFRPFSRNAIINGGMDIWARGATGLGTSTGTYTADRWVLGSSSTTVTRDTDVPVSPYFQYSMKMVGTGTNSIIQKIESANSVLLAGQTITISFYAKRTSGAGALSLNLYYPTAVDNFTSITQIGSAIVLSASPSSSWVRYQTSVAIGTNITAGLQMLIDNTGASTTFITGVQIEIGNKATPFTRAGGTIQQELAACQRYYQVASRNQTFGVASTDSTTSGFIPMQFVQQMRTAPTITLGTAGQAAGQMTLLNISGGYPTTTGTHAANGITVNGFEVRATGYSVQYVAGGSAPFYANGTQNVYVASAEL